MVIYIHCGPNTVPLTISYHQFRFLIGSYSVADNWYFIKKRKKNDKNNFFDKKQQQEENTKKIYVNIK